MKRDQADKNIKENRTSRLAILKEQRADTRLKDSMKQACDTCGRVVNWEDQMKAGPLNAEDTLLCPDCYAEFESYFSERFPSADAQRFLRWYKHMKNETTCRWCGAKLDPKSNYCVKCGRD
jgi:hypothetical protein